MSNEMITLGNYIGAMLQPIYFSLFLIFTKNIKNKRILFITIMIFEHLLLKFVCNLNYNINFELTYTIITYFVLKLIYKEKTRITDVITFIISIAILGVFNVSSLFILGVNVKTVIISNILAILFICLLKRKLNKIEIFYNKFWNRHNDKKMLKSVTIRGLSVTLTIIIFVLLHIWMICGIYIVGR